MSRRTLYRAAGIALPAITLAAIIFCALQRPRGGLPAGDTADAGGSGACRQCHEDFYRLWSTSRHGLSVRPAQEAFAADNVRPTTRPVRTADGVYEIIIRDRLPLLREAASRQVRDLPLTWAMGGRRVYYFLTPLERGRLQIIPLAYDLRRREWYDLASSGLEHASGPTTRPASWRDPLFTFNTHCLGCHVSRVSNSYDPAADAYNTAWDESGIACETCHGPGGRHIRAARALAPGQTLADPLLISTRKFSPAQHNAACLGCHAKVSPITGAWTPGERFFDHYDLVTLESPDYWPDGRDLGENYTGTGWLMNVCAARGGLHCLHCHTSSGRYRFAAEADANRACLPCHEARVRDAAAHTHHRDDGPAGRCVACHMPQTEFARMTRSDHSLRPPMPAATLALGSPNACNLCHADRDAAWADGHVRKWHARDFQAPVVRLGQLVAAARRRDFARLPDMLQSIADGGRNEVFAASLLRLLEPCTDARKWPAIIEATKDPSPLVRAAAVSALEGRFDPAATAALLMAADDEYRVVRLRAAAALAAFPPESFTPAQRTRIEKAWNELEKSFSGRPDDWTAQYNLGNYHAGRGQLRRAAAHYETARRLRPDALQPLVNAALVYARLDEHNRAEEALTAALRLDPENAAASYNLGLLRAQQGKIAEACGLLRTALRTDPNLAQAACNLALLLADDRPDEAVELSRRACRAAPDEPRYAYTLAFCMVRAGRLQEAAGVLADMLNRFADYHAAYMLLGSVHEKTGNIAAAKETYRRALARPDLDPRLRQTILARLQMLSDGGRP